MLCPRDPLGQQCHPRRPCSSSLRWPHPHHGSPRLGSPCSTGQPALWDLDRGSPAPSDPCSLVCDGRGSLRLPLPVLTSWRWLGHTDLLIMQSLGHTLHVLLLCNVGRLRIFPICQFRIFVLNKSVFQSFFSHVLLLSQEVLGCTFNTLLRNLFS